MKNNQGTIQLIFKEQVKFLCALLISSWKLSKWKENKQSFNSFKNRTIIHQRVKRSKSWFFLLVCVFFVCFFSLFDFGFGIFCHLSSCKQTVPLFISLCYLSSSISFLTHQCERQDGPLCSCCLISGVEFSQWKISWNLFLSKHLSKLP